MAFNIANKTGEEQSALITMRLTSCASCGVPFALPNYLDEALRSNHSNFYCPNGHSLSYGQSAKSLDITRLEKEKAALEQRLNGSESSVRFWNGKYEQKNTENKGLKIKAGKLKKRIANGICPCCHRTFSNLADHIKHMHPDEIKSTKNITV